MAEETSDEEDGVEIELDLSGGLREQLEAVLAMGLCGNTLEDVAAKLLMDGLESQMKSDVYKAWDDLWSAVRGLNVFLNKNGSGDIYDPIGFIKGAPVLSQQIRDFHAVLSNKA